MESGLDSTTTIGIGILGSSAILSLFTASSLGPAQSLLNAQQLFLHLLLVQVTYPWNALLVN